MSSSLAQLCYTALKEELNADERLLWHGQPDPARRARQSLIFFLIGVAGAFFTIIFARFMMELSQTSGLTGEANTLLAVALHIPTFIFGFLSAILLYLPFGVFSSARHSIYGLTEHRVILVEQGRRKTVSSIQLRQITGMERIEDAAGTGNLKLSLGRYRDDEGYVHEKDVVLHQVPNVRKLESLLSAARDAAATPARS